MRVQSDKDAVSDMKKTTVSDTGRPSEAFKIQTLSMNALTKESWRS